jgi:hypothetical protein
MTAVAGHPLIGRWRIVEADLWDRDYLDLVEPASITFGKSGRGGSAQVFVHRQGDQILTQIKAAIAHPRESQFCSRAKFLLPLWEAAGCESHPRPLHSRGAEGEMFKVIIWAADGSRGAELALPYAKGLALAQRARLLVVHVDELAVSRGGGSSVYVDEAEVLTTIRKTVEDLKQQGLDATLRNDEDVGGRCCACDSRDCKRGGS